MVWHGMLRCYVMLWYGMISYVTLCHDMVSYAMVCYIVLGDGMVWCGMVWYGLYVWIVCMNVCMHGSMHAKWVKQGTHSREISSLTSCKTLPKALWTRWTQNAWSCRIKPPGQQRASNYSHKAH